MDYSRHTPLNAEELNEANLLDAVVYGAYDEKIGSVSQVHGTGATSTVIVDVGGFLGLGAKPVAISLSDLQFMRDENGDVQAITASTKEHILAVSDHYN